MSFKKRSREEYSKALEAVLPEYACMSEAPRLSDLIRGNEENPIEIEHIIFAESKRRYKAIDFNGMVWLKQNPALMTYQMTQGASPVRCWKGSMLGHIDKFENVARQVTAAVDAQEAKQIAW